MGESREPVWRHLLVWAVAAGRDISTIPQGKCVDMCIQNFMLYSALLRLGSYWTLLYFRRGESAFNSDG